MPVVSPFRIAVEDEILGDLHRRLAGTRFAAASDDEAWSAGTDPAYLRELVRHWHAEFDWREVERRLNELPQYLVDVDGTRIHVVHVRAHGEDARLPLVLSHGWPSAFVAMLALVPLLTDPGAHGGEPADAFDVVVPSLPGIGYSELPSPGPLTRSLWAGLMGELGYDSFGAFGGDIGADVSNWLAIEHAERLVGLDLIHPGIVFVPAGDPTLTEEERRFFEWLEGFDVPVGVTATVEEPLPRSLCERLYSDIRQWREPGIGGHFMPLEQRELVARDIRDSSGRCALEHGL